MISSWSEGVLNPMMSVLIRDRKGTTQRSRGEGHMKREVEIEVMYLQAEEC